MTTVRQLIAALENVDLDTEVVVLMDSYDGRHMKTKFSPVALNFAVLKYDTDADKDEYPSMYGRTILSLYGTGEDV